MRDMVKRYTTAFPAVQTSLHLPSPTRRSVLVTGTTGSLGAHIVVQLASSPMVDKLFLFLRRHSDLLDSPIDRQRSALRSRGLDEAIVDLPNVVLLEGDLTADRIGLDTQTYAEVRSSLSIQICVTQLATDQPISHTYRSSR